MKIKKKAISLIVLVITIIVLAILAATVIVSLSNSGIINKSSDVVKEYDLAQVRSMANMAWGEALMDQKVVVDSDYDAYVKQYLTNAGVDLNEYEVSAGASGVEVNLPVDWETVFANATEPHPDQTITWVIGLDSRGNLVDMDDWAYLKVTNGYDLTAGAYYENIPAYKGKISSGEIQSNVPCYIQEIDIFTGPKGYEPVVAMSATFINLTELVKAPRLPDTVTSMNYTFSNCTGLKTIDKLPDALTSMFYTFNNCTSLTVPPKFPAQMTGAQCVYSFCTNLTEIPELHQGITFLRRYVDGV